MFHHRLIAPLARSLLGRLARVRETVAAAVEYLSEQIAAAVGQEVSRAVRDAIRRVLDLPDWTPPDDPYRNQHDEPPGWDRPDWEPPLDDLDSWPPPPPVARPRWRRVLSAAGRMAAVLLSSTALRWPILSVLTCGRTA